MFKLLKKLIRPFLSQGIILWTHKVRGKLAARLYGYPARRMTVIGVTGTNGKTTVCHLIASILQTAGAKVAMATTIDFQIGDDIRLNKNKMTTVSPFLLQKFLREAADKDCRYAIIETTSHALNQYRVWGIPYSVAVLTNITHDHLDYHKTFEAYRQAKEKMFAENDLDAAVINVDDPSAPFFLQHPAKKIYTYGLDNKADFIARKVLYGPSNLTFTLVSNEGQMPIELSLPGRFNVYNALAAIAVGYSQRIPLVKIKKGLEAISGVSGRMEAINKGQNFTVLIDYAHTPDALQNVYETVRKGARGKLIAVLGATGDRDKTKRPILGELAARWADYVIVTNEDPYTEDPAKIMDEVAAGVPKGRTTHPKYKKSQFKIFKVKGNGEGYWWWRILDRRQAIAKALTLAERGDIVLITGKGAEEVMVVGDKHIPWSDRKIVEELLEDRPPRPTSSII